MSGAAEKTISLICSQTMFSVFPFQSSTAIQLPIASDGPRSSSITFPPFTPNSIRLSPITRIDRIFPKRQEDSCSGGVSLRPSLKYLLSHNLPIPYIRISDFSRRKNVRSVKILSPRDISAYFTIHHGSHFPVNPYSPILSHPVNSTQTTD